MNKGAIATLGIMLSVTSGGSAARLTPGLQLK